MKGIDLPQEQDRDDLSRRHYLEPWIKYPAILLMISMINEQCGNAMGDQVAPANKAKKVQESAQVLTKPAAATAAQKAEYSTPKRTEKPAKRKDSPKKTKK